jgi:hypothetical protein
MSVIYGILYLNKLPCVELDFGMNTGASAETDPVFLKLTVLSFTQKQQKKKKKKKKKKSIQVPLRAL